MYYVLIAHDPTVQEYASVCEEDCYQRARDLGLDPDDYVVEERY